MCSTITTIGPRAFENTNITHIDLSRVIDLDLSAFNGTKINELIINQNITRRRKDVFDRDTDPIEYNKGNMCYSPYVEKITIGSNVGQFIPGYLNNPNLKEIIVDGNPLFVTINKVIYTADKETLYAYPGGLEAREFTIPSHVKFIRLYAFAYCRNLEKIIVNSNVLLTDGMFSYCTSVKTIEINNETDYFPAGCFAHCANLTTIKLPENVIITRLFYSCFQGCSSLQILNFRNQLKYVGESCFKECDSLIEIDFSYMYKIPPNCFRSFGKDKINLLNNANIKTICKEAFMESSIAEFVCPENLIIIEEYAFAKCSLLKSFKFNEKISIISDYSFSGVGLEELFIPNSLKSITPYSFRNSNSIRFNFSEGGHPIYYVENNCFMNKNDGLIFIIEKRGSVFEIPNNVKMISSSVLSKYDYYQFVINSDTHDSAFLNFSDYLIKLCITSPNYAKHLNEDCLLKIYDKNNADRYAKEGEYEPTYKLNNNLYMNDSFSYIYETITESTFAYYVNQSLPFLQDLNAFSIFHSVLLVLVSLLSVVIIILSIIALKITHE